MPAPKGVHNLGALTVSRVALKCRFRMGRRPRSARRNRPISSALGCPGRVMRGDWAPTPVSHRSSPTVPTLEAMADDHGAHGGEQLRRLRELAGMTIAEVAARAGVASSRLAEVEDGIGL